MGIWNEHTIFRAKTNPEVHKITFFNDDLFIQVSDRPAGLINSDVKGVNGRGVVYRRIK